MTPISIVAYIALFVAGASGFLAVHLLIGRLLRPNLPSPDKQSIYECGEPAIGSSFVQFDLRFYVVALLFIIFDVEVAFFFPWATVFGKATQLVDPALVTVEAAADGSLALTPTAARVFGELGVPQSALPTMDRSAGASQGAQQIAGLGYQLASFSLADILVFFAVLMVGFAYVWRRGDLDWVRAVSLERANQASAVPMPRETDPVLSA